MSNPIQWCEETWNPVVGCSPVSAGCDNCYAARMANRFKEPGEAFDGLIGEFDEDKGGYSSGPFNGRVEFKRERLSKPFSWKKPRRIFVTSMGDLWHPSVTDEQITEVFGVIAATPRHIYMDLTKRPERRMKWLSNRDNSSKIINWVGEHQKENGVCPICEWDIPLINYWVGVSIEDQDTANERIPLLLQTKSCHHFVSFEPAINMVDFNSSYGGTRWIGGQRGCVGSLERSGGMHRGDGSPGCPSYLHHHHDDRCLKGLDLAIMGAETGPRKRKMDLDWARSLRDQCKAADVHFWFKKDSDKKETLDGVIHHPEFWK